LVSLLFAGFSLSCLKTSIGKFLTGHSPKFLMFEFYQQKEEETAYICGAY
jgi:hypothetical protein